MGFSLKVNCKKIESGLRNPPDSKKRDQQFELIEHLREQFFQQKFPVISVDGPVKSMDS